MNILILNHYASIPTISSAETRHFEMAKRLIKKGHNISIVVGNFSHLLNKSWKELMDFSGDFFEYENIKFYVVNTRNYLNNGIDRLLSSFDYYKNGKKITINPPDIIVASSPHPFSWNLGNFFSKKFKVPFVIEIRDIWPDDLVEAEILSEKSIATHFFNHLCKKFYPKSSGIITLIPDISEHLNKLNINYSKKIEFIPNGISFNEDIDFNFNKEIDNIFKNIPQETIKVVYTGSHGPSNGLEFVIRSIRKLPENIKKHFSFIFIGQGSEKEKLVQIAKDEKSIFFLNPVPKNYIPYILKNKSDILLFSLEDFKNTKYPAYSSFKLMDYMKIGKPILSIYHPGLILAETEDAIFYHPEDTTSFIKAVKHIYNNFENIKNTYGKKNRNYVKKNRDWDYLTERFEKFLLEIVNT